MRLATSQICYWLVSLVGNTVSLCAIESFPIPTAHTSAFMSAGFHIDWRHKLCFLTSRYSRAKHCDPRVLLSPSHIMEGGCVSHRIRNEVAEISGCWMFACACAGECVMTLPCESSNILSSSGKRRPLLPSNQSSRRAKTRPRLCLCVVEHVLVCWRDPLPADHTPYIPVHREQPKDWNRFYAVVDDIKSGTCRASVCLD